MGQSNLCGPARPALFLSYTTEISVEMSEITALVVKMGE